MNEAQIGDEELASLIVRRIEAYQEDLEGVRGLPLHEMILCAVEKPLFSWALSQCHDNQKAAAKLLGINRNTLHKKLVLYGLRSESN